MYIAGALKVLVADESSMEYKETGRFHLSISHPYRYPKWDEIKDARYSLLPDNITMAMLLPTISEYVNFHQNCFHLYEVANG